MDRARLPPPRWATPVGLPSSRENGSTSDRDQQEAENARLKRLVAELALDKQMLQEVVQKKC